MKTPAKTSIPAEKIVLVPCAKLNPAPYNPRKMDEKEANDLRESLRRFGLVEPIVVNAFKGRENIVIGGHQRLRIAMEPEFAWKTIPVVYVSLPEDKERELNLRLNKNVGSWDWDLLAHFDLPELLEVGFSKMEVDRFLSISGEPKEVDTEDTTTAHECPSCGYKW